jgi:hypothetical protein
MFTDPLCLLSIGYKVVRLLDFKKMSINLHFFVTLKTYAFRQISNNIFIKIWKNRSYKKTYKRNTYKEFFAPIKHTDVGVSIETEDFPVAITSKYVTL